MATHKVSVAAGLAGYLLLIVEMSGLGVLLRPLLAPTTALVLLWYGLYFGILGRDAAEVASDRMARTPHHRCWPRATRPCPFASWIVVRSPICGGQHSGRLTEAPSLLFYNQHLPERLATRGLQNITDSRQASTCTIRQQPTWRMWWQAVVMGTRRSLSVSLKDCGICGSELADYRRHVGGGGAGDNGGPGGAVTAAAEQAASVQLACKHLFHPSCIKGWTLVGATLRPACAPEAAPPALHGAGHGCPGCQDAMLGGSPMALMTY